MTLLLTDRSRIDQPRAITRRRTPNSNQIRTVYERVRQFRPLEDFFISLASYYMLLLPSYVFYVINRCEVIIISKQGTYERMKIRTNERMNRLTYYTSLIVSVK